MITEVEQLQNTLLNWLFGLPDGVFMLWKELAQEVILPNALRVPSGYIWALLVGALLALLIKRMGH